MKAIPSLVLVVLLVGIASSAWHWRREEGALALLRQRQEQSTPARPADRPLKTADPIVPAEPESVRWAAQAAAADQLEADAQRLARDIEQLQVQLAADPGSSNLVSENQSIWNQYRALANQPEIFAAKKQIEDKVLALLSAGVRTYVEKHGRLPEGMTGVSETIAAGEHVFFHSNFDHGKFEIVDTGTKTLATQPTETIWIRSRPLNDFDEIITVYADGRVVVTPPQQTQP